MRAVRPLQCFALLSILGEHMAKDEDEQGRQPLVVLGAVAGAVIKWKLSLFFLRHHHCNVTLHTVELFVCVFVVTMPRGEDSEEGTSKS